VQQPGIQELLHHHRYPADAIEIAHVVLAVRFGISQMGHPGRHLVEVVESQLDPSLIGDGQQVEHRVGGAPQGHGDGDGILKGLFGHHLSRPNAGPKQVDNRLARHEGGIITPAVDRGSR
jgi:hypothetical protein